MDKKVYTITDNALVATGTYRLVLSGEVTDGEFVHLDIPGYYLRRPLSLCDVEDGKLTLLYKTVGEGTRALAALPAGTQVSVLTGLGKGFNADACQRNALLVGGGMGTAPLLLLARRLKAQGKHVTAILGFNTREEIVLRKEYEALCDTVLLTTVDGSEGIRGFVTDAMKERAGQDGFAFDYFYTCGPMVMMRAVCRMLDIPGEASLEERMGCGAGFCYGCSIQTAQGPARVCKDGPVFKKEDILW